MTDQTHETLASVDLGSNSFHMLVAKVDADGRLSKIDSLRESVRLGGGLTEDKLLTDEVQERGLQALKKFRQRLEALPQGSVRVAGTNTLRKARNASEFIKKATEVLGHPIEVISGREEARLIYLGVANGHSTQSGKRLIIDIGGGSTEMILGEGMDMELTESVSTGCVELSKRYFDDGQLTFERFERASLSAKLSILPVSQRLIQSTWEHTIGCSGTIKAIRRIVLERGWSPSGITLDSLYALRREMIKAGHVDKLSFESLKKSRRPVLAGGLADLIAVFEMLQIEEMEVSKQALREGLLYDLIGRMEKSDVREHTVQSFMNNWRIDRVQAEQVADLAVHFFHQVKGYWAKEKHQNLLRWAGLLHEIGLQISHRRYHRHGAYVLANADLAGFSFQEQQLLATLVLYHRRKCKPEQMVLPELLTEPIKRLCVLLRLAVLFCRQRVKTDLLPVRLEIDGDQVFLMCDAQWLEARALLKADLEKERKNLSYIGIQLNIVWEPQAADG